MDDTDEQRGNQAGLRPRRRLGRRVAVAGSMALALLLSMIFSAGTAQAYARGCKFWNPFTVAGYSLAVGQYCAEVDGDGSHVDWVEGDFTSAGNVCNWDITAEFFDSHWVWKQTLVSSHEYGCTHQGQKYIRVAADIDQLAGDQHGYMCSTLRAGYQRITSQCHYVHPAGE